MIDFGLVPLTQVTRPRGPWPRTSLYRLGKVHPELLLRLPGMRETFVSVPVLRQIEATAVPVATAATKQAA